MKRYARLALVAALSIVATAPISQTVAANYSWTGTSANWNIPSEWNPSTVPGPADTAWILDAGTANIGPFINASCGTLVLGGTFGGSVNLANSLTAGGGGELVGYKGNGQINQTSGTNSTTGGLVLGNNTGSSGSYNLSGGALTTAGSLTVGNSGSGTFIQTGGVINQTGSNNFLALGLSAGGSGSYSLSGGGSLNSPSEYIGYSGSGSFSQTGGTNFATTSGTNSAIYLGYNAGSTGTYNLGGGSLASPNLWVGYSAPGAFVQTGGTSAPGILVLGYNFPSGGSCNLSGSGLLTAQYEYIGYSDTGTFTQSGGMNAINSATGALYIGNGNGGVGAYYLTGGTLSIPYEYIGANNSGYFTQSGGVHAVTAALNVGYYGYGEYDLSGSGVLSAQQESVAYGGYFNQTGGTNVVASLAAGNGYNLGGGLLRVANLSGSGLSLSGGTMQVLAGFPGLYNSPTISLNFPGGVLDTNGIMLTFYAGVLVGPGGLNKGGAGALILNGTQGYTGPTIVSGGTLEVPNDFHTSSFTATGGGILQFPGTTLNLGTRVIQAMAGGTVDFQNDTVNGGSIFAMAGGTVVYQNATLNNGYLFGPGTHILPAGSATTFNTTTINPGTSIQEAGNDKFFQVTDRGTIAASGSLTILGGINDGGANMTVNGTADVSSWSNAGVITVTNSGLVNNHVSDLTSYGGARIYVNGGGTLNADSQSEGVSLDLQDSLLVNNGRVTGTTNVYYGATVSGSGSFGPINVMQAGAVVAATSAVPAPTSLTVTSGSIAGSGNLAVSATIADAILATPNLTDVLTLSGNLSGSGPVTKIGEGTLILSGTNTFGTGVNVGEGTLIIPTRYALPDGANLTVGSGITAFAAPVAASAAAQVVSVPEPGTLALLVAGAALLATYRKQR